MEVACSDMTGLDHQKKGFHTFLMTGDAIIRTNFNPFKPTRQLSLDSHPVERPSSVEKPKTERSVSHQDKSTTENNNEDVEEQSTSSAPALQTCPQNKEFIPGFMRVDDSANSYTGDMCNAEDSGIDVRLSGELDDNQPVNHSTSQENNTPNKSQQSTHQTDESSCVDEPSAKRLATRLYQLDRFKLSDVCHYLSKR